MKPIRLEIEGLESFRERQIINFESLCEYGIFGIFGETGSGKSTILDGIILALYGEIPKEKELAQSDEGLKNFLNNSSDKMEVYFKFSLGEDIFEISRKYGLGKTKGVDTLKTKEVLMKKNGVIIAEKAKELDEKLAEDFGLGVEDFKRTVVLPQGKFSEFLKLRGEAKRKTIENIFNMERYGKKLKDKANAEKKSLESEKDSFLSQKENIEPTSKEDIKNFEKLFSDNKNDLKNLQLKKLDFDKYYTKMATLKDIILKYNNYLKEKTRLLSQEEDILLGKQLLEKSQNAEEIKEYILKNEKLKLDFSLNETNLKNLTLSKDNLENKLNNLKSELKFLEENYKNLELKRENIDFNNTEYLNISNAYSDKKMIVDKEKILEKLNQNILQSQKEINDYKENISVLTKESDVLSEKIQLLPKFDENQIEILNSQINNIQNTLIKYEENQKEKIRIENSLRNLEKEKEILENSKKDIIQKLEILEKEKIKNLAFELSKTLEEGKPCPVCGSRHHLPFNFDEIQNLDIDKDIKKLSKEKEKLINEIGSIQGNIKTNINIKNNLEISFEDKLLTEKEYDLLKAKLESLKEEVTHKKKEIQEIKNKLNEMQNNQIKINNDLSHFKMNLSREEKNLGVALEEVKNITAEKNSLIDKVKEYFDIPLASLKMRKNLLEENQKELESLNLKIKSCLNSKNKKSEEKDELSNKVNEKILDISKIESDITHIKEQISINSKTLDLLLEKYNFSSQEEVKKYYLVDREKDNLREKIKNYNESLSKILALIEESEKTIDGRSLSDEEWQNIQEEKLNLENSITNFSINISNLEKDIIKKREDLKKIKLIDTELKKIDKKLTMAEDIYLKLRTKDFVSFLVDKKLKNVVTMASQRLNNISNGRYMLTSDENSNFYVVDFFNEGKKRRTATLSGGETFIVSLCLALALSKQLQLKGKRPLEFFFLDEGFGSLDSKLLDKVMDSIENIRSEEKIKIGIITHLEDLKLRILKRIEVEKAVPGERGSRIKLV